eukprot:TRINITY_DN3619_c0_g1_i1.p2 TRINITY_DN3619_c0_g1~~TRINITY_DN3619_c0_g1_i1.p2  ORF type:complete len:189 (+),score=14.53 TRINITY_DN3619_c0_g1_i1:316-882(+)
MGDGIGSIKSGLQAISSDPIVKDLFNENSGQSQSCKTVQIVQQNHFKRGNDGWYDRNGDASSCNSESQLNGSNLLNIRRSCRERRDNYSNFDEDYIIPRLVAQLGKNGSASPKRLTRTPPLKSARKNNLMLLKSLSLRKQEKNGVRKVQQNQQKQSRQVNKKRKVKIKKQVVVQGIRLRSGRQIVELT